MAVIETIEGTIGSTLWYHYDVPADVLYLQRLATRGEETFAEETPDGLIRERTADGRIAGMTVIDWWKRFGHGALHQVSLDQIEASVETLGNKLAA